MSDRQPPGPESPDDEQARRERAAWLRRLGQGEDDESDEPVSPREFTEHGAQEERRKARRREPD